MDPLWLAVPGFIIWITVMLLPWRPWSTRESLDAGPRNGIDLTRVTALIPARNEAEVIGTTLQALADQGDGLRIILVDDQSTDGTAAVAGKLQLAHLEIIRGRELPPDWSGKLWALEQGLAGVGTEYVLLLDADIELKPGILPALLDKITTTEVRFASLMACLRMHSPWEKWLMPAFIYFFKLLYPFRVANSGSRMVAAAAGGCILTSTAVLRDLGGFAALKHELIDDCALARRVKDSGCRTWIGLTHSAVSHRPYDKLANIWDMVARTAYTQLGYSVLLLLLCTLLMCAAFVLPLSVLFLQDAGAMYLGITTMVLMAASYLPVLKYYGASPLWALTLPAIGFIYLLMTWNSAVNHWRGAGSWWKDRSYTGQTG